MIFSKYELRNNVNISNANMLTIEDLIDDFAVSGDNKVLFPIGKIEHNRYGVDYDKSNPESVDVTQVYTLDNVAGIKTTLDTLMRSRLRLLNKEKYILGDENITSDFPYFGPKAIKNSEVCRLKSEEIQQYLIENNFKVITVSHEDCGYDYRCGGLEREYADFTCDGTNDTEVLQNVIESYPDDNLYILLHEDEYILKPTSGSGTEEDPYICLNIDRDNIIIRSCNRKTNLTFDRNIVKENDKAYLIKSVGSNVDISNLNFCLDELDIHYVEYAYPKPTEKMLRVKEYVESFNPIEKQFSKKMVVDLINKEDF